MNKYIKDFTELDYKKLFDNNEAFRELAYNKAIENVDFWIGEYLGVFKDCLKDYSIGAYNQNYLRIGDIEKFIKDIAHYIESFGSSEELEKKYKKALEVYRLYNIEEDDEKAYKLYNDYEEAAEELKKILLNSWVAEYEYYNNNDNALAFIIEELEANEYLQDYYIKNDDYSKLYVIIPEHEEVFKYIY